MSSGQNHLQVFSIPKPHLPQCQAFQADLLNSSSFFQSENNCCAFLLYKEANQLSIYIDRQGGDIYMCVCMCVCLSSPPSRTSLSPPAAIPHLQVITEHHSELPVLSSRFPLATYFTLGSIDIQYYSLNWPHPSLLTVDPHVCSLHPCPIALQIGSSFWEEKVCFGALLLSLEGVMANQ